MTKRSREQIFEHITESFNAARAELDRIAKLMTHDPLHAVRSLDEQARQGGRLLVYGTLHRMMVKDTTLPVESLMREAIHMTIRYARGGMRYTDPGAQMVQDAEMNTWAELLAWLTEGV